MPCPRPVLSTREAACYHSPWSFRRNGDSVLTCETDTQGPFQSDNQSVTYYEPTVPWDDEPQTLNSSPFNIPLFPMPFAPSSQATADNIPAGQPTPSSAYVSLSTTSNISMNILATTAAFPASAVAPPTSATNATTQSRFGCPLVPQDV